jgi:hypothetical protein
MCGKRDGRIIEQDTIHGCVGSACTALSNAQGSMGAQARSYCCRCREWKEEEVKQSERRWPLSQNV